KLLAADSVNSAFVAFARHAYTRNIAVGRYVIMPDHLHLFVCGPDDFELGRWIGVLKQNLAKQIEHLGTKSPIWQRGFFDHLLRSDEATRKNGITSGRIQFARDWSETQTTGRIPGRSSESTGRNCSRRPAGDVGLKTPSALRFPQGSGYRCRSHRVESVFLISFSPAPTRRGRVSRRCARRS